MSLRIPAPQNIFLEETVNFVFLAQLEYQELSALCLLLITMQDVSFKCAHIVQF